MNGNRIINIKSFNLAPCYYRVFWCGHSDIDKLNSFYSFRFRFRVVIPVNSWPIKYELEW